ncbi:hypothetical protein D9756_011180 [Leucocoprinus leucothites]|uniref:Uncharacterized protein n=1 Tax=Leucocoprinus leucothites TaxID=201217 RepID=A0A8H5CN88_9AGAR|nr:hypothetical protein D9756_011180 [Leucoagaricus leucothites]
MIYGTAVKVLLVLRLRAVWNNARAGKALTHKASFTSSTDHDKSTKTVTLVLYFITAVDTLVKLASVIVDIFVPLNSTFDRVPLHGCYVSGDVVWLAMKASAASVISRAATTTIETLLCLVSFAMIYRMREAIGPTIHERISHVRSFTPLIYVVYRDGTLLFLPIWIFSALTLVNTFNLAPQSLLGFKELDWNIWGTVVYSIIGARLIINIRKADCGFGESLLSREMHSGAMPQFHNSTDHDDEDSPSTGESGGISNSAHE